MRNCSFLVRASNIDPKYDLFGMKSDKQKRKNLNISSLARDQIRASDWLKPGAMIGQCSLAILARFIATIGSLC